LGLEWLGHEQTLRTQKSRNESAAARKKLGLIPGWLGANWIQPIGFKPIGFEECR
jgi:hypothetical protein